MNDLSMPLLELTSSQHSFQNHLLPLGARKLYHVNDMRLSYLSRSFKIPTQIREFNVSHIKVQSRGVLVSAVATLEPKISVESDAHDDHHRMHIDTGSQKTQGSEHQSTSEEFADVDDKEKLRRMRISKANKGNTPWNKGRKHSPETLRRIREKTKLAMQDPKVKMKLVNLGHAQSEETRIKIGFGVRMGWNKRREKLMLQETCHFDWQNLIAEASRRGLAGEEELQWDSYKILDEQLEREWLESVEQRKRSPRPKGSKRAPKSAEQKRKISEAIAAKWADPAYRDRVYSGLSKYHGTPIGADNPRRRPKRTSTSSSISKKKKNVTDNSARKTKSTTQQTIKKRSKMPIYTDPLASSKLEMIKNIRADRENKKAEAITRAKLLIAEAEKAAKALELAATKSPLAQASLIETRKLIAEAIQSIESIEGVSDENDPNILSSHTVSSVEKKIDAISDGLFIKNQMEINGCGALLSNFDDISGSAFDDYNLQELLSREDELLPSSAYDVDFLNDKEYLKELLDNGTNLSRYKTLQQKIEASSFTHQLDHLTPNGSNVKHGNLVRNGAKSELGERERPTKLTKEGKPPKSIKKIKKWVRGKLVEVREED